MQPTLLSTQTEIISAQPKLVRLPTVMQMTGLCRSTIYSLIAERQFPGQVQLSKRAVAWRQTEVEQWTLTRPAVSQARHADHLASTRNQAPPGAVTGSPMKVAATDAKDKRATGHRLTIKRRSAQAS
ncbi:AlpA family transcriptional regulator [Roseateles sp.]|uniref:AlpA family transcriptional regulator n=1 Tax=Roseateles sp. TaxID=1971397 RepID=UPI003D1418C8